MLCQNLKYKTPRQRHQKQLALKWKCKLEFAETDVRMGFPLHVYPQPTYQGWEITKIRIILHRNSSKIRTTKHLCDAGACKTHRNVRLHIATKAACSTENLTEKAGNYLKVGRF